MSDGERQKYRMMAKSGAGGAVKYTTYGVPINYIAKVEEEAKLYERKMFEEITNVVSSMAAGNKHH